MKLVSILNDTKWLFWLCLQHNTILKYQIRVPEGEKKLFIRFHPVTQYITLVLIE